MTVRREGSKHFCTSSTLLRRLMCSWLHAGQVVRCRLEQIINCIVMASTQGGWHWDFIDAMQFLFLKYSHHPLSACHFNSCIHLFPAAADTALAPDFLHARDLPSLLHPGDKDGIHVQCPIRLPQVISLTHMKINVITTTMEE